jgi:hypothetical protein
MSDLSSANARPAPRKGPPPPPEWTLEKVITTMENGRSILIVTDITSRRKYEQKIIAMCVSRLGIPTSSVSEGGAQHYATYWPNKVGLGFVLNPPWDPPSETDVCRIVLPSGF